MLNTDKTITSLEVPVKVILELSNDQELGKKVREMYYSSLKNQEHADSKRNDQARARQS